MIREVPVRFESNIFKVSADEVFALKKRYCDSCNICGGTRIIETEEQTYKCECLQKFNDAYALAHANVPTAFRELTSRDLVETFKQENFDNFKRVRLYSRQLQKALDAGFGLFIEGENGTGKCIKFDTKVVNPETGELLTVEELYRKGKTIVLSLNKKNYKLKHQSASIINNGVKPCYEIVTKYGRKISITNNHPLLTLDGWKQLKDLKVGDKIAVPRVLRVKGKELISDNEVRLLGFLIGDGCTTAQCGFTNGVSKVIAQFKKDIKDFSSKLMVCRRNSIHYAVTQPKLSPGKRTIIQEFMEKHGLRGKHSWEKSVPDVIFKSTNRQIALFVNSLYACDGSVYKKSSVIIEYDSTSEQLIYDLQHLLLRFGISGNISSKRMYYKVNGKKKMCRKSYRLIINDSGCVNTFLTEIGALGKTEGISLRKHNISNQQFTVPAEIWGRVKTILKLKNVKWNQLKIGNRQQRTKYAPSFETIKKIGKSLENAELKVLGESDILWHSIKTITYIGRHQTYDLSVSKTHNFVCNDIIVHNSFIATLILKHAIKNGYSGYFILMSDLINAAFEALRDPDVKRDLEKLITKIDFLVIDEVDKGFQEQSDTVQKILLPLFKKRCDYCKKPLIVTSNIDKSSIDQTIGKTISATFTERLTEITFTGNYRPQILDKLEQEFFND